jgi:hypothetical protein
VEYASSPTNTEGDPSNAIFAQKPGGSDAPQAKGDD